MAEDDSSLGKVNDDFIAFDYTDKHKPIKRRKKYISKRKIKDIIKDNPPQSSIRGVDDRSALDEDQQAALDDFNSTGTTDHSDYDLGKFEKSKK